MLVGQKHYRTIWLNEADPGVVKIIDQRHLPHEFVIEALRTVAETAEAIRDMHIRGAGLIGATAGYGMYLAALAAPTSSYDDFMAFMRAAGEQLKATRPTAVNLEWAVNRQLQAMASESDLATMTDLTRKVADEIADEDASFCRRIGEHGVSIIEGIAKRKNGETVNILTHCNAGWLAFVDYGSATAPIYEAHRRGIPIHVWVDETRPRNQGASLTAWELGQQGIPHSVIVDNAGGHLMQHALVDMVIVGSDRTTYTGDVCNKIGTYLKALAARDNSVPFYAALPSSTFDWVMRDGINEIPIEERNPHEVTHVYGQGPDGTTIPVQITPKTSPARNFGFDVTPARLVAGIITERGICSASEQGIQKLFPEKTGKAQGTLDEGSLKYRSNFTKSAPPTHVDLPALNQARTQLHDLKLIGALPNGIGYGNISLRVDADQFIISATATGATRVLSADDWVLVTAFDLDKNEVSCCGQKQASAETMSHGAIYRDQSKVTCVIHIHHAGIWRWMRDHNYPSTPIDTAYGTPQMAQEIADLVAQDGSTNGVFAMGGHEDGVIAYGATIQSAMDQLLQLYHSV